MTAGLYFSVYAGLTFLFRNNIMTESGDATKEDAPVACWIACCLVRRATKASFEEKHRAMTAPDILEVIGKTFHDLTQE